MGRFERQAFLVTGGTRGIGRAVVLAALEEGGRVVFCARPGSEEAREVLRLAGPTAVARVRFVAADIAVDAHVERLFDRALAWLGHLDVVVSNAGAIQDGLLVQTPIEAWERVLRVNLRAHFLVLRRAVRELTAAGGGRIVTVSSIAANGLVGQGAYAAAKAGLLSLTRSVAAGYGARGIRCNAVVPSFIETEMVAGFDEPTRRRRERLSPHGRFGRPEEVAEAVLFLASGDAAAVNGDELYVSGAIWEDWNLEERAAPVGDGAVTRPDGLQDRVAVVTGAGGAGGRAVVAAAAARGAKVVCCAPAGEPLPTGCDRILPVVADVSREADVEDLFDRALDAYGRVDAVVNCARGGRDGPLAEVRAEDLDAALATNLTGAFLVSVRAVEEFLAQGGGGRIVSVGSTAARGAPSRAILATSQGGLHGLTRTIAKEYGRRGVYANLVLAGENHAGAACAALFLAGDRASFINGATLDASGGGAQR
jgi:3-oxoacyl-[acyl-carrier protein] reductase